MVMMLWEGKEFDPDATGDSERGKTFDRAFFDDDNEGDPKVGLRGSFDEEDAEWMAGEGFGLEREEGREDEDEERAILRSLAAASRPSLWR